MSGAPPYDLFHIAFGLLGTALVAGPARARRRDVQLRVRRSAISTKPRPGSSASSRPEIFRYKVGDHVAHVVLGLLLAAVGFWGLQH